MDSELTLIMLFERTMLYLYTTVYRYVNPLTAGVAYIGVFTQLLPHSVPPFKHVKAIM